MTGREGTAAALRRVMDRLTDERPSLEQLVEHLGDRAPAFLLLTLAIPALVPSPGLPAGFLFGSLLAVVAAQMAIGHDALRIPGWIGRRRVKRSLLHAIVAKAAPVIERVEARLRTRTPSLTRESVRRPLGGVILVMGILIALPIPFGNTLPALAVLVIAMGLLARDGLAVATGLGISALAAAVSVALVVGTWKAAGTLLV